MLELPALKRVIVMIAAIKKDVIDQIYAGKKRMTQINNQIVIDLV
jgi:hypothetical protein